MANLTWNSVTGQWNAASWSGALPVVGDSLSVDGRVKQSFLSSLDRSADVYATERVTNGDFAVGTGWTLGTGWTIAGGLGVAAAGSASDISQAGILVVGRSYKITYTVSGRTAGTITAKAGTGGTGVARSTNATFTEDITCDGDTTLYFSKSSTFDGDIDDVSVVESVGLDLELFKVLEEFVGDVGQSGNPVRFGCDLFIYRGQGKLYLAPSTGNGQPKYDRLIIDTPNLSHEITLTPSAPVSEFPDVALHRGRLRFTGASTGLIFEIGFRTNPILDTYAIFEDGVFYQEIYQTGGTFIYKGIQDLVGLYKFGLSGGYCQLDGKADVYTQTSGHCDFGVEQITSGPPTINEAWLLGGSMDATRAPLGQIINTAYISPQFNLIEDDNLTITNRINTWE